MNTAVINIKTDPKLKRLVQKKALEFGLSLSTVLNVYLRKFLQAKSVEFSDVRLELTPWAKRMLKKSEEDFKAGKYKSFTPDEYVAFLDTMTRNEQTRQRGSSASKV